MLIKKIIALGIMILIIGGIILMLSQEETSPATKNFPILMDRAYTKPYPLNPSITINLTKDENFTIRPPTLAEPPTFSTEEQVYVDIVNPNGQHMVNSNTDYWDYIGSAGGNWQAQFVQSALVCAPNGTVKVDAAGTYIFTFSTDPLPLTFLHIIIGSLIIENAQYSNSYLYYPSIILIGGGGFLTALGFLSNRKSKAHRRAKTTT